MNESDGATIVPPAIHSDINIIKLEMELEATKSITNNNSNDDDDDNDDDNQIETNTNANTDENLIKITNEFDDAIFERQEDMIDAAKQGIEVCIQKINNIQYILENPKDGDNNTTYKRKQKDLKITQAFEWAKIKQLRCDIHNIHENDDMLTESDVHSDLTQLYPELWKSLNTRNSGFR